MHLSVLDLSPIPSGFTATDALRNTIDLAARAERAGFTRYWLAEHHNMASVASSAPEIMIGQVAARTKTLRVGAGGIMLPNHSPLKVAELFRVLSALFPGRIDLALGRAAGTDPRTANALRPRIEPPGVDAFAEQVDALIGFLRADDLPRPPFARNTIAVPAGVAPPALFLLGSSDYGSRAAAKRGFGFAFARHMNPADAESELRHYRSAFEPSAHGSAPLAIVSVAAVCAPTDEEAQRLARSGELSFVRFMQGMRDLPLPSVEEAEANPLDDEQRAILEALGGRTLVGAPSTVAPRIRAIAEECRADEVMILTHVHEHEARCRSYELLAEALTAR
ncbi:MAG: LLM class flavin-dependent oxidoreductase [Polyangiaceae bacterium]